MKSVNQDNTLNTTQNNDSCFDQNSHFPQNISSSKQYVAILNETAQKMGVDYFEFMGDQPNGRTNVPDLFIDGNFSPEIQFNPQKIQSLFGYTSAQELLANPIAVQKTQDDMCYVINQVEQNRQKALQYIVDNTLYIDASTHTENKLASISPVEREWINQYIPALVTLSNTIYGLQVNTEYTELSNYMDQYGDAASQESYRLTQTPQEIYLANNMHPENMTNQEAKQLANNFPFYPDDPAMNSCMWPADMTPEELDYIKNTYSHFDPILRPYTVVERITAKAAKSIQKNPIKNKNGDIKEWVVTGLSGNLYRVTNIVFHERFSAHFQKIVNLLRESSLIQNNDQNLPASFMSYLVELAYCIDTGDFERWLQTDLNQSTGHNLFLTFFPHEGMWSDGVKFPFMFELGLRDKALTEKAVNSVEFFNKLEDRAEKVITNEGLNYSRQTQNIAHLSKAAEMIWSINTGGFIRTLPLGQPKGHDYPKVEYNGISDHKTIVLLDTLQDHSGYMDANFKLLFNPDYQSSLDFNAKADFVLGHEESHGASLRPEDKVKTGVTFSQAFGDYFWLHGEPYADTGSFVLQYEKFKQGQITEEDMKRYIINFTAFEVYRALPPAIATMEEIKKSEQHYCGASLIVGYLCQTGCFYKSDSGVYEINFELMQDKMVELYDHFTRFAATGDLDGFNDFYTKCVNSIFDDFVAARSTVKESQPYSAIFSNYGYLKPIQ